MELKWKKPQDDRLCVHTAQAVTWLSFPLLDREAWVGNAFSTREGGVSEGIWRSMNLSYSRGDEPARVTENFHRIAAAAGFPCDGIVTSDQTHTANVRLVTEKDCGSGILRERDFHDVDGLVTDRPGVVLTTFYADCVPLYFVDPVHRAIGLAHSGWRGTVQKMGQAAIRAMEEAFGTRAEELLAAVGPSICQDCYEVSEDVIEEFQKAFAPTVHDKLYRRKENGKYQLNLWEANRQVLLEAGVRETQIQMPNLCTCCNPNLLFSHRASQGKRGNLAAFLWIRP